MITSTYQVTYLLLQISKYLTLYVILVAMSLYEEIPMARRDTQVANRLIGAALGIRVPVPHNRMPDTAIGRSSAKSSQDYIPNDSWDD